MSPNKTSVVRRKGLTRPKRTSLACCTCRRHKVKCFPRVEQLGSRCERCLTKGLTCTYMPVSEHMPPSISRARMEAKFDSSVPSAFPPDGATSQGPQGATSDSAVLQSETLYPSDAVHLQMCDLSLAVTSVYEDHTEAVQQPDGVTRYETGSLSEIPTLNPWFGVDQPHESLLYYQPSHPLSYTGSSSRDSAWPGNNAAVSQSAESNFSPAGSSGWVHGDAACPYPGPFACNCLQGHRGYR